MKTGGYCQLRHRRDRSTAGYMSPSILSHVVNGPGGQATRRETLLHHHCSSSRSSSPATTLRAQRPRRSHLLDQRSVVSAVHCSSCNESRCLVCRMQSQHRHGADQPVMSAIRSSMLSAVAVTSIHVLVMFVLDASRSITDQIIMS